jgi:hypothetical protein
MNFIAMAAALAVAIAMAAPALAISPPKASARLYIARPADPHVPFPIPLRIDGKGIDTAMAPGVCVYMDLLPGTYKVHALSEGDLSIDLASGDAKFVELEAKRTDLGSGEMDEVIPTPVSRLDTSNCQSAAINE